MTIHDLFTMVPKSSTVDYFILMSLIKEWLKVSATIKDGVSYVHDYSFICSLFLNFYIPKVIKYKLDSMIRHQVIK